MKAKAQITKDYIFESITEEDIFRRYSEYVELDKHFLSPFIKENTPSCHVFESEGYLKFKCFSTGLSGNCFDLVRYKYKCNYEESLLIIANDFGLFKFETKPINLDYIPGIKPSGIKIYKDTIIKVRIQPFDKEDLDYWLQYGITNKSLTKYDIYSIDYYWLNYHRFKVNFGFAYFLGNNKYKIMQPTESKDKKWFGNTKEIDIQGLNQLSDNKELLVITSSLKDIACLNENYNLECISGNSETTIISELQMSIFKQQYKNIIVYLNNDEAGIKASKIYEDKYQLPWIINPKELSKDPSDCFKNKQNKELTKFLCQQQVIKDN
jgi:hypothetical protein